MLWKEETVALIDPTWCQAGGNDGASRNEAFVRIVASGMRWRVNGANSARNIHKAWSWCGEGK